MPRKRAASSVVDERPSRRSGRISRNPKKSIYFEDDDDLDQHGDENHHDETGAHAKDDDVAKGKVQAADDDRRGEEEEDDEDSDAPPRVIVLPLKQLRGLDGVEYEDTRLHKNTLLFLQDLKANNKRSWLKSESSKHPFPISLSSCWILLDKRGKKRKSQFG